MGPPPQPALEAAEGERAQTTSAVLVAESLSLRFATKSVLREVCLAVRRRTVTAIVGPSGCGKTSFLCCLNRLTDLREGAVVEGRIELDGRDLRGPDIDAAALRRQVGMVFQRPNPFPTSIGRNLEIPLREHGTRRREDLAAAVRTNLEAVGLWPEVADGLDRPALDLSGGQQQRLCIARALTLEPQILLMDEPTSSLDPISTRVIETLILTLRRTYAIVLVTHDLAQAERLADRVAVFQTASDGGRLVEEGEVQEIFSRPRSPVTRAYLGSRFGGASG